MRVAVFQENFIYKNGWVCVLSRVQLFATLWTIACQTPLSMGFSRQEYWSGLPCLPLGVLPNPGIKPAAPVAPALAGGFFTIEPHKWVGGQIRPPGYSWPTAALEMDTGEKDQEPQIKLELQATVNSGWLCSGSSATSVWHDLHWLRKITRWCCRQPV